MSRSDRTLRAASVVMGVLFSLSALVQLNDPDPIRWIAVYGVAAALSFAASRRTLPAFLPAAHAVVALGWALVLLPSALETSFGKMFGTVRMMSPEVEEGRETLGLAIVGIWMVALAWAAYRARKSAPSTS